MGDVETVWLLTEILWLLVALACFIYQFANAHRSRKVRDRNRAEGRDEAEVFLTTKRYEQELTLLIAGTLLFAACIGAIVRPNPTVWTQDGILRFLILWAILCCQVTLARHSSLVHSNHHDLVNRLTARRLRRQHAERQRDRNVTANTAATLANTEATRANTAAHTATLQTNTEATDANTAATEANTATIAPRQETEDTP